MAPIELLASPQVKTVFLYSLPHFLPVLGAGDPVHDVRGAGVPLDAALVPARGGALLPGHALLRALLHVPRQLPEELGRQLAANGEE